MENNNITVPYIVHEGEMTRQERNIKRLVVIIMVLLFMLFGSNIAWLYEWNQYEYVDETIESTQDGDGINIVGGEDVTYGSDSSNTQKETQEEER